MKRFFILVLVYFIAGSTSAQFIDNFAMLSAAEIQLRKCEFDPEADAAILLDEGNSDYENGGDEIVTYYHIRIKILRKEGIDYGNISVGYRSGNDLESIDEVEAVTINFDENGRQQEFPVAKKSIYRKKISDKVSEMSFAFPQVKVGSIIEYRYRSVMKSTGWIRDWYFQTKLPVYLSKFTFRPSPRLEFMYVVQKSDNYPIDITKSEKDGKVHFQMKNIPGLNYEPYMDSREDYIQKISFQVTRYQGSIGVVNYMRSWDEVAKQLLSWSDFGGQLNAGIPSEVSLFLTSLTGKTDLEKMMAIYDYVRKNFSWNEEKGIQARPGFKGLWVKKTGNAASINLALVNFLKEAKLEACPMVVSERANGKVNVNIPFVDQFNSTYASVVVGGRQYFLDATDPFSSANVTPSDILNTSAFIIRKKKSEIIQISEGEAGYKDIVYINSVLSDEGEIKGQVQMISKEYARSDYLKHYKSDKKNYVEHYLKRNMANIDIDSLIVKNDDEDSLPLEQNFKFRADIQRTGDYAFLNLNMFSGFESSPFIQNNRFSNINFGSKRSLLFTSSVYLPANLSVDALPKNMRVVNADNTISFTRQYIYSTESGQLVARIKIELNKSLYSADEYSEIKEFFTRMTDLLNEQIVLKKKA